jgi:hypothetical protein
MRIRSTRAYTLSSRRLRGEAKVPPDDCQRTCDCNVAFGWAKVFSGFLLLFANVQATIKALETFGSNHSRIDSKASDS